MILVGYSWGGIVISPSAEARPDKVKALVYLAAFLIPNGEPMIATALGDTESLIETPAVEKAVVFKRRLGVWAMVALFQALLTLFSRQLPYVFA